MFSHDARIQLEGVIFMLTNFIIISAVSFHFSNIGFPLQFQSNDHGLHMQISNTFFPEYSKDLGPNLDFSFNYNDLLFFRIVDRQKHKQQSLLPPIEEKQNYTIEDMRRSREYEPQRFYRFYPRSQHNASLMLFESSILDKELDGYSVMSTCDQKDIWETLKAINASHTHQVQIQQKNSPNPNQAYYQMMSRETIITEQVSEPDSPYKRSFLGLGQMWPDLYELLHLKPRGDLYIFSQNKTLLSMSIDELMRTPHNRVMFLQADLKSKHVAFSADDLMFRDNPDTFVAYTVLKAAGKAIEGGFISQYLQDTHNTPGPIIDFQTDFGWATRQKLGWLNFFSTRLMLSLKVLYDLICLFVLVYAIHQQFVQALASIGKQADRRQPNLRTKRSYSLTLFALLFYFGCLLYLHSKIASRFSDPAMMLFIATNCQLFYLLGSVLLTNTELQQTFYTSVIGYSYLLHYYSEQYPHVPLLRFKLVYCFRLVSIFVHRLNSLAFKFESRQTLIDSGFQEIMARPLIRALRYKSEAQLKNQIYYQLYDLQCDMQNSTVTQQQGRRELFDVSDETMHQLVMQCVRAEGGFFSHQAVEAKDRSVLEQRKYMIKLKAIIDYVNTHRQLYSDLVPIQQEQHLNQNNQELLTRSQQLDIMNLLQRRINSLEHHHRFVSDQDLPSQRHALERTRELIEQTQQLINITNQEGQQTNPDEFYFQDGDQYSNESSEGEQQELGSSLQMQLSSVQDEVMAGEEVDADALTVKPVTEELIEYESWPIVLDEDSD